MSNIYVALSTKALEPNRLTLTYRGMSSKGTSFQLLEMINPDYLSLGEAILLLRVGIDLGTVFSDRFWSLTDSIASSFYKLDREVLKDLDLETAQFLVSSPSL